MVLQLQANSHSYGHYTIFERFVYFPLSSYHTPMFTVPACSECGDVPVPHGTYKLFGRINGYLDAISLRIRRVIRALGLYGSSQPLHRFALPLFRFLAACKLGSLTTHKDPRDSTLTATLFDSAKRNGVDLYHFRPFDMGSYGFMVAHKEGKHVLFYTMPRPRFSDAYFWLDDKVLLKEFLIQHQLPAAGGGAATSEADVLELFKKYRAPFIAKPHAGSRGRHTTINITTEEEAVRAFHIARQLSPWVVFEEELAGTLYRVTVIDGVLVAAAQRDFPGVYGDGVKTVRELCDATAQDPKRDRFVFFPVTPNERAEAQLRAQHLSWSSVPEKGVFVRLNDKISRLHGAITIDVTDTVHPENRALFEKIVRTMGDLLIGMDFIMEDITRP
jgi:D-alanine-D-alanine ligase-like ATP-grasp enzyme